MFRRTNFSSAAEVTGQLADFGHHALSRHARETPRDRRSQMFFSHFAILASKYALATALLQVRFIKAIAD